MNDRDIMKQALEALQGYGAHSPMCDYLVLLTSLPPQRKPCSCGLSKATTALNERLAQPEHHDPIGDAQDKLIAGQAARPCKVGGPCVPTQTGPCACEELPQSVTGNVLMDAYHAMQAKKHAARTTDRGPVAWLPPDPPPECKSEAEKTAFAFGWFKALEAQRAAREEAIYETIIQWDEGGGKRSRRELARRIVALYANTGDTL